MALSSGRELGLVNNNLAIIDDQFVYVRDPAGFWRTTGVYKPAFGSYRTAIASAGFRPSRVVDSSGQVWHFSATSTIDTTTGRPQQRPVYRVEDAEGREVVATTEIDNIEISSGKPVSIGGKVFFFYLENWIVSSTTVSLKVATWDITTPSAFPTITVFWVSPGATTIPSGFDAKLTADDQVLAFFWGSKLDGSNAAVAAGILDRDTGEVSGTVVYGTFSDNKRALKGGCLFRDSAGLVPEDSGSFLAGVTHFNDGTNDYLEVVAIDSLTLAFTFHQAPTTRPLNGTTQLGGVIDPVTGNWDLYLGDCVSFIGGTAFATETQSISAFSMPSGGGASIETLIFNGGWPVADPIIDGSRVLLVVGHDTVLSYLGTPAISPQRSYSLWDATNFALLARVMYEATGGDCDGLAGLQATGGYLAPVELDGTVVTVDANACRDGLSDFYTVTLTFDLDPTLGPPIQFGDDWILPGGYPQLVGNWQEVLEMAPMFFPDAVTATVEAASGSLSYDGEFTVCATYALIAPDGREVESQPSAFATLTTSTEFMRIEVPTCKLTSTFKVVIRVYSTVAGGSILYRQSQQLNDPYVDKVTFDLPKPGLGASLYTEGGVIENSPVPPFKVGMFWDNRVFVGGLAERGLIYPSKFIRTGKLPEFFFDGRFGIGNFDVHAMGAIDKNRAAIFHSGGISVISRGGPTDAGTNPYEPTDLTGIEVRCENPRSICTTGEGCVFQATDGGIYLLTKSLQVVFIGKGIDDYSDQLVTSAIYLPTEGHLRLTLVNQHVVVFDFGRKPVVQNEPEDSLGQWYDWPVPFGATPVSAAVKDGVHYVLGDDGKAWPQVADQAFDDASTFIPMKVRLPLTLAGVSAYLRCLRGVLVNKWVAPHKVLLTVDVDGTTFQPPAKTLATSVTRVDFRPNPSKASHFVLTIEEQQSESLLNKGFKFEGVGLAIQRQPGLGRTTDRMVE